MSAFAAAVDSRGAAGVLPERHLARVAGLGVDTWPLETVVAHTLARIRARRQGHICVASIHGLVVANEDPAFRELVARAALVLPDGMPLVWAAWSQGFGATRQITGFDFVHALSAALGPARGRIFYYGGPPGLAERMAERLTALYPGLVTAGSRTPPFRPVTDDELRADAAHINAARPDVIWVGLPTPQQERWMGRALPLVECPVAAGVGAAFDFVAGTGRLPPRRWRRLGLGWLHRVWQRPEYWRRYAYVIPRFGLYHLRHLARRPA